MLTKDDLKQIENITVRVTRKVVRDEISLETEDLKTSLASQIISSRMRVQSDIHSLSGRVKNVEIAANNLQKDMTIVKKGVKKLQKDVDGVIEMADKGLLSVQKRVVIIEKNLKIPSPDFV